MNREIYGNIISGIVFIPFIIWSVMKYFQSSDLLVGVTYLFPTNTIALVIIGITAAIVAYGYEETHDKIKNALIAGTLVWVLNFAMFVVVNNNSISVIAKTFALTIGSAILAAILGALLSLLNVRKHGKTTKT